MNKINYEVIVDEIKFIVPQKVILNLAKDIFFLEISGVTMVIKLTCITFFPSYNKHKTGREEIYLKCWNLLYLYTLPNSDK